MGLWAGTVVMVAATWAHSEQQGYKTRTLEADAPLGCAHLAGEGGPFFPGKRLESHSQHGYFGVCVWGAAWGLGEKLSG